MKIKLLVFVIFSFLLITPSVGLVMPDITGHWAEDTIKEMADEGLISGYDDGTFRPNNDITRAEFAA